MLNQVIAVCERCGSVCTAQELSDRIKPVGTDTCPCGNDEFRQLTWSVVSEDDPR